MNHAMNTTTRQGLSLLGAGLAVGLIGDLLLPVEPWGLNMLLCTTALVLAGAFIVRRSGVTPSGDAAWLAVSALLLGAAFVRRDAAMLHGLDILALVMVFGLAWAAATGVTLRGAHVGRYINSVFLSALSTWTGAFRLVFGDIAWGQIPMGSSAPRLRGVGLGVLVAAPLLVLFGSLFAAADPVFAQAVRRLVGIDLSNAVEHGVRTAVLGAFAAGYLRGIALPRGEAAARPAAPPAGSERATATLTVLGLLNLLFLSFVVVQLRYFFGGADRVESVAGLTYAEYARNGFFELVWASAFVVPVLLGADWAMRHAAPQAVRWFRITGGVTLGLISVIIASALERMRLYVDAFGLTDDRLYATAGMIFLTLALGWLGWTVLRGRAQHFAFGATIQGLLVLGGLHALNPDAFILRHNLTRPAAERAFDVKYATQLGADAAPQLLDLLPRLSGDEACLVARRLDSWAQAQRDWRTWNWSRSRAARLGRDPRVATALAGCPATSNPDPGPRTPVPGS